MDPRRAERETDSELAHTLRHTQCHHAIESNAGQKQSEAGKCSAL